MKVKDIMYKKIYSVPSGTTSLSAAKMLVEKNIGSFLVKKNGVYVGIVTEGDYVVKVIAKEQNPATLTVDEMMSYPFIMIDQDADVLDATDLMVKYQIKRLIVVNKGKIAGIISRRAITKNARKLVLGK